MAERRQTICLGYAALCAALVVGWQALTVCYNYKGNWTALFYTGSYMAPPAALNFEKIYVVADSEGYDGQFYHYVAHDPFLQKGMLRSVDNPRLRWRRILIPGLAYLLAAGQPAWIDPAFFAVTIGFVAAGVYWASRYCAFYGLNPAWGACFVLVPGVLASLDRMTIDAALAALCAGFALYGAAEPSWKVFPILALAPLARETGFCLLLGAMLFELWRRDWVRAAASAAMALPGLAWTLFVHTKTADDLTAWLSYIPLSGLIRRTLDPVQFALTSRWVMVAAALDYAGAIGIWVAIMLTVWLLRRKPFGPLTTAIAAMALPAIFAGKADIWNGGYEFGRTMSPLLVLLALQAVAAKWWWGLAPLGLIAPRILFQLEPQLKGIVRGLIHGS